MDEKTSVAIKHAITELKTEAPQYSQRLLDMHKSPVHNESPILKVAGKK